MDERRQQCQGLTRRGTQCTRRAKAGSAFCGQHDGRGKAGGAPSGNVNARKHGFYSVIFTSDEVGDLAAVAVAEGLADEIALLRVRLRRALVDEGADLDAVVRACSGLSRMLKAQRVLTGEAANEFERAMADVLDGLVEELGLGLG